MSSGDFIFPDNVINDQEYVLLFKLLHWALIEILVVSLSLVFCLNDTKAIQISNNFLSLDIGYSIFI